MQIHDSRNIKVVNTDTINMTDFLLFPQIPIWIAGHYLKNIIFYQILQKPQAFVFYRIILMYFEHLPINW